MPGETHECGVAVRPCPHVHCRYNLNVPGRESARGRPSTIPQDSSESCVLDVACSGPISLERTGQLLGLTRERTRQIEVLALRKLVVLMEEYR